LLYDLFCFHAPQDSRKKIHGNIKKLLQGAFGVCIKNLQRQTQTGDRQMTRYFANSAATRKNRPLTTGMDTEAAARQQAEFLANTYGGVAQVSNNSGVLLGKFSAKRGWH
jgi:hypothetical protein